MVGLKNRFGRVAPIRTGDVTRNRIQENLMRLLNRVAKNPILQGSFLKESTTTQGKTTKSETLNLKTGESNEYPHGLGREIVGFIVVALDTNSTIWINVFDEKKDREAKIDVRCSADCKARIWVF